MSIEVRGAAVRLDNADFAALAADPGRAAYAEVLALPGMAEGLAAVRAPLVQVDVVCSSARGMTRHHAWVSAHASLFLLTVRRAQRQLVVTPPAHLPSGVARAVRLGPQPVPEREAAGVDPAGLEDIFDDDPARRRAALEAANAESAWSVTSRWTHGERRVVVLTGADGLWLLDDDDDGDDGGGGWSRVPVSASDVWRLLTLLLPGEDELNALG